MWTFCRGYSIPVIELDYSKKEYSTPNKERYYLVHSSRIPVKIDRIASLDQSQENHSGVISCSADILSAIRRQYTITCKKISVNGYMQTMLILKQINIWKVGCLKNIILPKFHLKITKVYKPIH